MNGGPGVDPLVNLHDEASVEEAIRARQARRTMHDLESEIATLVGTLRDMAERRQPVTILTDHDQRHQGIVAAVAADHIVVVTPAAQEVHLPLDRVHHFRADPSIRAGIARGSRDAAQDLLLHERLARWVARTPHLALFVTGRPDPLRGRLVAVGEDILTLRGDHDAHPIWIRARSVRCVIRDM